MNIEIMSDSLTIDYADFCDVLSQIHEQRLDCCVYLTVDQHSFGQIMFEKGQIVFLTYAQKRDLEAIDLMNNISTLNYRIDRYISSTRGTLLKDTASILSLFASFTKQGDTSVSATEPALSEQNIKIIEGVLEDIVGPMATFFMEDHVQNASSVKEAVSNLSTELSPDDIAILIQKLNA